MVEIKMSLFSLREKLIKAFPALDLRYSSVNPCEPARGFKEVIIQSAFP